MTSIRKDLYILGGIALMLHVAAFCVLFSIERHYGDIDGDPTYAFPVVGQDSPSFVMLGDMLETEGEFSLDGVIPETFRTPGYPAILALSHMLFGNFYGAIDLQILLSIGITLLVYRMGLVFSRMVGWLAALLYALSPNTLFHASVVLSDTIFTACIVSGCYLLFVSPKKENTWWVGGGGLLLGFASLIRPIGFPIFILVLLAFVMSRGWRTVLQSAVLCTLGFAVVAVPWATRNLLHTGTFGLSSVGAYNLFSYNAPDFLKERYGEDSPEVTTYQEATEAFPHEKARQLAYAKEVQEIGTAVIYRDPLSYGIFHLSGTSKFFLASSLRYVVLHVDVDPVRTFFGLHDTAPDLLSLLKRMDIRGILETLKAQPLLTLDRVMTWGLTICVFASIFLVPKEVRVLVLVFLTLIVGVALLTGPVSMPRYRLPVEPFMYLLASVSLWRIVLYLRRV